MTSRDKRLVVPHYRGSYHVPMNGTWMNGTPAPYFACPDCGRVTQMLNHTILDDGTVEASVGCTRPTCEFHEFVILQDWL